MNIFKEIKKVISFRYHKVLGDYALTKMQVHARDKDDSKFIKWCLRGCKHYGKCLKISAE